jgi:hypothetical protein
MFSSPLPAANLSPGQRSPIPFYFDYGQFSVQNGVAELTTDGFFLDPAENATLTTQGGAVPIDSNWTMWNPYTVAQEFPLWLRNVYVPSPAAVHVFGKNTPGTPDYQRTNINAFLFDNKATTGGDVSDHLDQFVWQALADRMGGRQCTAPFGDPTVGAFDGLPAAGPHWLQGLVATLKTALDTSKKDGMGPAYYKSWDADSVVDCITDYGYRGPVEITYEFGRNSFDRDNHGVEDPHWPLDPIAQTNASGNSVWFDEAPVTWHDQFVPRTCVGGGDARSSILSDVPRNWPKNESDGVQNDAQKYTLFGKTTTDDRVRFALNSRAPNGDCDAAWQFTQALALGCVLDQDVEDNLAPVTVQPMEFKTLDDLAGMDMWLKTKLDEAGVQLEAAYVENIPTIVLANVTHSSGSLAGIGGSAGEDIVKAANGMLDVYAQWNLVLKAAYDIQNAVEQTRNAVDIAFTEADQQTVTTAIQRLSTIKALANDVAQIMQGVGDIVGAYTGASNGAGGSIAGSGLISAGITGLATDGETMSLLDKLKDDTDHLKEDKVLQALLNLG